MRRPQLGYLSLADEARLQELLQLLEPHLQAADAGSGEQRVMPAAVNPDEHTAT